MPLQSIRNQYHGINAHLLAALQARGGWAGYHNSHIAFLEHVFRRLLLPLGYSVSSEPSLQVRRANDDGPGRPDLLVRAPNARVGGAATPPTGEWVVPLPVLEGAPVLSDKPYFSLLVRDAEDDTRSVLWLELLSPANKRRRRDRRLYARRRRRLMATGVVFVELDYLPAYPPTFPHLPNYARHAPGSQPFAIVVADPRPTPDDGWAVVSRAAVDAPLPPVTLPLLGADSITVDFDAAHSQHYEAALYGLERMPLIDYAALPADFARYSPDDQTRIANVMLSVRRAAAAGTDLETGPFDRPTLPLADALAELEIAL